MTPKPAEFLGEQKGSVTTWSLFWQCFSCLSYPNKLLPFLGGKHSFFLPSRHTRVLPGTHLAQKQRSPSSPSLVLIISDLRVELMAKPTKAMRGWWKFSAQTCLVALLKHWKPEPVPLNWELPVTMTSLGGQSQSFCVPWCQGALTEPPEPQL